MTRFITAFEVASGRKRQIPAHWLDVPSIAKHFKKTPAQRRRDGEYSALTVADLRDEISRRNADRDEPITAPAGAKKADLVALLERDDQTPSPDGGEPVATDSEIQTPGDGDEKE